MTAFGSALPSTRRRALAALAGACAAALLACAPALAAPPWSAPVTLGEPVTDSATLATGAAESRDGTGFVAFTQYDTVSSRYQVRVAVRPPGSAFGTATPLDSGSSIFAPAVAVDRQGNATAVWNSGNIIRAAYRPAGGSWQAAETLASAGVTAAAYAKVAVGDNGAAVAVWEGTDGTHDQIKAAYRSAGATAFSAATTVYTATGTGSVIRADPEVAMDAVGDSIVAWKLRVDRGDSKQHNYIAATTRPAGGPYSTVQQVSEDYADSTADGLPGLVSTGYDDYELRMTPSGRAFMTWTFSPRQDGSAPARVQLAERVPGATFGSGTWSVSSVSPADTTASASHIAVDDAGGFTLIYAAGSTVQSLVRSSASTGLIGPKALSGSGAYPFYAALAESPGGEAVAVWPGSAGGSGSLYAARRRPGADAFGDATTVHTEPGDPSNATNYVALAVALDDEGNGILASGLAHSMGAHTIYSEQAFGYDPIAPVLGTPSIPNGATVGTPAAFSAAAADRGGIAGVTWDFGDGATASGAGVSHAYGAPGAFVVTVSAADVAGNVTSAQRTILVAAAPPATQRPGGTTPGPSPVRTTTPARRTPSLATLLGLPSTRSCISRTSVRLHVPARFTYRGRTVRVTKARLLLGGRTVKTVRGRRLTGTVSLRHVRKGKRFTLGVKATTSARRTLSASARYKRCGAA